MKPILLRVDDFPGVKPEEFWKHNLENFKVFDALLEKHGIEEYIVGVIPRYTKPEHIEWLSQNPRIEVALHGVNHDNRFPSEFRDHETEDDIYRKLLSAKEPLKRCNGYGDVHVYIPPFNAIDIKTCRALKRANFTTVLCGPGTDRTVIDAMGDELLFVYSRHPVWYGRSDEMLNRDSAAERIRDEIDDVKNRCVTLHWTWEWNIGLDHLDRLLREISDIFRS